MDDHFCRRGGVFRLLLLEKKKILGLETDRIRLPASCHFCGSPRAPGDFFCRHCGQALQSRPPVPSSHGRFDEEIEALFIQLKDFRLWIDKTKKKNVRFMEAYKISLEKEINPQISALCSKHATDPDDHSNPINLMRETALTLTGPIHFMETKLRPSVGMGIFLERWMMTSALETYLKECCRKADGLLDQLAQLLDLKTETPA